MVHRRAWHRVLTSTLALTMLGTYAGGIALAGPRRTLIRNAALVLTMDPALGAGELGVREQVDILLDGDTIARIGGGLEAPGARVVDATGRIVLPGFVDTHDHLHQSLIRGCATDQDLNGWLKACVYPLSRFEFRPDDVYRGVRVGALDLIATGVTTVVDWSHAVTPRFAEENVRALTDSGLRFAFAYYGRGDAAVIAHMRHVKGTLIDPNPRARFQVGSHPAIDRGTLSGLVAMSGLARELGVKLHVHLLENVSQTQDGVLDALAQAGALGPSLLGAHGIHLTDADIQLLARHDVRLVHNPLSNMRLASGIIRLPELKQAGVQVGLGLDGGTNDTADMFNTMRAAVGLQRARLLSAATVPTVSGVLRMATVDGARLLDMDDRIGSLTPGKKADLIVLDPRAINFGPRGDWISQIVFNGQPANVEWVFMDGRALKARGRLVGADPAAAVKAADEVAARIRKFLTDAPGTAR
jgi:5-methylthioadenosine/S-adenosylhomocysteine deaminase